MRWPAVICARPDYEVAISAAVDYLESRPDVDADKICLVGQSMGGYYGARLAKAGHDVAFIAEDVDEFELSKSARDHTISFAGFAARTIVTGGRTLRSRTDCFVWYDGRR